MTKTGTLSKHTSVAIIHDSLFEFGGAERLVIELLSLFPQAHLYTTAMNDDMATIFSSHISPDNIHTLFGRSQFFQKHSSLFQMTAPFWWGRFDLHRYDIVISSTAYKQANLAQTGRALHIQYINNPPKNLFGLEPKSPLQRIIPYTIALSGIYTRAVQKSEHIIANSLYEQTVLKRLFGIQSTVIYPPVHIPNHLPKRERPQYYLSVSRLDHTKHVELAIQACTSLGLPLKVVGRADDSAYHHYLRSRAGPTIEFMGFCGDKEMSKLYQSAIAFLFTSKNEDFGIAPVEAIAHGVPVISYHDGGVKETMVEGETGQFFYQHSVASLIHTLVHFKPNQYSAKKLYQRALLFSTNAFKRTMKEYVLRAYNAHIKRN